jgi:hypothetical protein
LWLRPFKREEEEKVIEVMKKGRMEEGGGCGGCSTVKKKVTDFSVPSHLPAGKNLIRRLGRGKSLTLFYSVITSSGPSQALF